MVGEPGTWWQRKRNKECDCKDGSCKYGACNINVLDKIIRLIKAILK